MLLTDATVFCVIS